MVCSPRPADGPPAGGLRSGSLCTGYGGLDMAVMSVFAGRMVWCAENDKHAAVVLDARYPNVPNLGDLTMLDWQTVRTVDLITAGFPCQDICYTGRVPALRKEPQWPMEQHRGAAFASYDRSYVIVENVPGLRQRGLDQRTRGPGRNCFCFPVASRLWGAGSGGAWLWRAVMLSRLYLRRS